MIICGPSINFMQQCGKSLGETGASCNSFTFEPCNVVVNGTRDKQNITSQCRFDGYLMQIRIICKELPSWRSKFSVI